MKKIFALALCALLMLALFAGCGGGSRKGAELALITDTGAVDDKSFNQGAWEGLVKYAEEKGISHQYYQPAEQDDASYLEAIDAAVQNGAKLIVAPGAMFEETVWQAQDLYPDTTFVLIDGTPHDGSDNYRTNSNTVAITYAEEQVGFLAGYAAVREGMTKLGYMGGIEISPVVKYGYGFVQGAEYAAQELGMADGSIELMYTYTGEFAASTEVEEQAAAWYGNGTEIIFAAGGALGGSVMTAAEAAGSKVIGVDVDQSGQSDAVITSATKGLGVAVYDMIKAFYDGSFPGGENLVFNAANNGISLAMDTAKFSTFTKADYDALFAAMQNNTNNIASNILTNEDAEGNPIALADLPVKAVIVTQIKKSR